MTTYFFKPDNGQCKDMAANSNQTAAMMVSDAAAFRRWADSRANDPAFAAYVARARQVAAVTMQQHAPRAV